MRDMRDCCKLCDLESADTKQVGIITIFNKALSPTIQVALTAEVRIAHDMPVCLPESWV